MKQDIYADELVTRIKDFDKYMGGFVGKKLNMDGCSGNYVEEKVENLIYTLRQITSSLEK